MLSPHRPQRREPVLDQDGLSLPQWPPGPFCDADSAYCECGLKPFHDGPHVCRYCGVWPGPPAQKEQP
jgi:hypothetical protein